MRLDKNARGFGSTPNNQIPLNDRPPGTIAGIAWAQLMPYQIAAQTWPIYQEMRAGETMGPRWVHACRVCTQAMWFNSDEDKVPYDYTDEEITTLIVSHIRRCHEDMVNEKGEYTYESAREHQILDNTSVPNSPCISGGNAYRPDYQGGDTSPI
jgi:hypothetical protein